MVVTSVRAHSSCRAELITCAISASSHCYMFNNFLEGAGFEPTKGQGGLVPAAFFMPFHIRL